MISKFFFFGLAIPFVLLGAASAADVTIHVTGAGNTAKYIKEGDTEQKDVTVRLEQTVKWANDRVTTKPHTATSVMKDAAGARIFDTMTLAVGASKEIKFTRDLFTRAGGVAGGKVELEYFCVLHGIANMKSKIILDDTPNPRLQAFAQARVVPRIVTVSLNVEGDPQSLKIDVTGEVPTADFTDSILIFAVYIVPPADGLQDLYLLAAAPTAPPTQTAVSQVDATVTWKAFKMEAPWIKGVRVHGVGTEVVEKMLP